MHASAALLLAVAGFAAAQTNSVSTTPSGCGTSIDLIIESCLGTTKSQLSSCASQDWDCLCEQSNNVLTCYNNCPSAPDRFGYEQTKVANCNAAKAYGTSTAASSTGTAAATASASSSGTAASTTGSSPASSSGASGTRTGSAAAETSTQGSAAGHVAVPAGLAAIFGLAAFL